MDQQIDEHTTAVTLAGTEHCLMVQPRVTVGFKMKQIEQLLHKGRIRSMAQLRSKSKRELDELGLALGPRAKISGAGKAL